VLAYNHKNVFISSISLQKGTATQSLYLCICFKIMEVTMKKSKIFKKRLMAVTLAASLCASIFMGPATLEANAAGETVEVWLSNPNNGTWLKRQSDVSFGSNTGSANYTINVNENTTYQTMDGFGASLTDSSCWLLYYKLSDSKRKEVLNNLFGPNGINISALRQPIGSSDFNWEAWTFCDTTNNTDDKNLNNFSLWREDAYIRPILDQAYNVNKGRIKIFATPWTPPAWMKTGKTLNGDTGGTLRTDCYDAYANYFVKYLQGYAAKGTPVYAISVQNEPLFAAPWCGMKMSAQEQVNFINVLGPKLQSNGLNTKIIAYDHNYDNIDYAKTVFNGAGNYVSASGFHYYSDINHGALTNLHNSYPNKDIYFTEGGSGTWIGGGTEKGMFQDLMMHIIRFPRNWAKSYIMWNVALNPNGGPVMTGSSSTNRGLITINDSTTDSVTYNCQYYGLGHSSKFVDPGAVRIESNTSEGQMENVAYKNPDGSKVVVLSNRQSSSKTVKIVWNNQAFTYTVPAEGAITFKWKTGSSSSSGSSSSGSTTTSYPAASIADGNYYFKGVNTGKVVCAENTGNDPLAATRDACGGAWETISVVNNSDGTISLKSAANSKYVCAVIDESNQLLARSSSIGTWEKFNLVRLSSGNFAIKAVANGKYVCADQNKSSVLYADRDSAGGWETFKIYKTNGTQIQ